MGYTFEIKCINSLKVKGWIKISYAKSNQKKNWSRYMMRLLDLKVVAVSRDKQGQL